MGRVGQFEITVGRCTAIARVALRLARDRSGIAAIEYALIASLIAVAIVMSVTNLGTEVGNHWDGVAQSVEGG